MNASGGRIVTRFLWFSTNKLREIENERSELRIKNQVKFILPNSNFLFESTKFWLQNQPKMRSKAFFGKLDQKTEFFVLARVFPSKLKYL